MSMSNSRQLDKCNDDSSNDDNDDDISLQLIHKNFQQLHAIADM